MIINLSGRSDIVQYYSEWMFNRFKEGYVLSRNPFYPTQIHRYKLSPDVLDAIVFCSKNYQPALSRLHEITDVFNTYFHYTITAYGKDIEPGVPSIEESIQTLYELEKLVGKQRIAWRYDPILITKKYTVEYHLETFEKMARMLSGHIDRCIFSFVEMYKRLDYNMPEIIILDDKTKDYIASKIGKIASKYNITIQICGSDNDYTKYGINLSGCMTSDIIGKANNITFKKRKHPGMRNGCHCMENRDIGQYDSCLNGCKYCYANKNPQVAFKNYRLHDVNSPLLLGNVEKEDVIKEAKQESYLEDIKYEQISLF